MIGSLVRYNLPTGSTTIKNEEVASYVTLLQPHFSYPLDQHLCSLFCDKCPSSPSLYVTKHEPSSFDWLLQLQCHQCSGKWYLCKSCKPSCFLTNWKKLRVKHSQRNRQQMFISHHLQYHGLDVYHNDDANEEMLFSGTHHNEGGNILSSSLQIFNELQSERESVTNLICSLFGGKDTEVGGKEYFLAEYLKPGTGKLKLISLALADSTDPYIISDDDAVLHLMLTRQFLRSTRLEREYTCDIYSRLNERYQEEKESEHRSFSERIDMLMERIELLSTEEQDKSIPPEEQSSPFVVLPPSPRPSQRRRTFIRLNLPTQPKSLYRYLESKKSVVAMLPCPDVLSLEDGYAYVSVSSVLKFVLAMGIQTHINTEGLSAQSPRSCYNKPAFLDILAEQPNLQSQKTVALSIWIDGVDTGKYIYMRFALSQTVTLIFFCPSFIKLNTVEDTNASN